MVDYLQGLLFHTMVFIKWLPQQKQNVALDAIPYNKTFELFILQD